MLKLEIYAPEEVLSDIQDALLRMDAGHIGNYRGCMSYSRVTGSWIPDEGSNPATGSKTVGERAIEPEIKIEVIVRDEHLKSVMKVIKKVHPYEEPVINVIRLE